MSYEAIQEKNRGGGKSEFKNLRAAASLVCLQNDQEELVATEG